MPPLVDDLRTRLEKAVTAARDQAEAGARAALQRLYVDTVDSKAIPAGFPQDNRALRVHLRAHARQLGDEVPEKGPQRIDRLVAECAYEFWHRMLFARFLIENHLLIHPEHRQPIPLADLEEFAHEAGVKDKWEYAASCAARMLPEIFRPEDPLLRVPFAPEHQLALEQTLDGLPAETFTADDSLGWVYQFWQAKRKDEVNASEVKIGGAELPAVTQLFTEPYMVQFLLHNTLGAWWYARQVSGGRKVPALPGCTFDYLRFREAGNPAAGTFPGWPQRAAELKVLDPCCGSGHFLVAAFELLARIRMHDEGLAPREACDAVLRDNLFGLELDARCTQIAAFNLALAAWKFPDAGGYRQLPQMHIACSGQALRGRVEEWERLAGTNRNLRIGMRWLYEAFRQAPDLGSLLDPADVQLPLGVTLAHLLPLLRQALQGEEALADAELAEQGVAAWGIAKAAETLAGKYHLVTTNVPYLAKGRQSDELRQFAADHYSEGRMDLATVFLQRCLRFLAPHGLLAAITPQTWLFLTRYRKLREKVVRRSTWLLLANLGAGAFASISGEVVNVSAVVLSSEPPAQHHRLYGVEVIDEPGVAGKKRALRTTPLLSVTQSLQLDNPDSRISLEAPSGQRLLSVYAQSFHGISTTDYARFGRLFWEVAKGSPGWTFQQSTVDTTAPYSGREHMLWWQDGDGELRTLAREGAPVVITGSEAWGKRGVAISQMSELPATVYTGELFDDNTAVIVPLDQAHHPAIWAFCSSSHFRQAIRKIDRSIKVTYPTMVKIPFDLARWEAEAKSLYPKGLPKPFSNDPTQWLFKGDIATADAPHNLQVAMARLLGYRWPDQAADKLDRFTLPEGILSLVAIGTEPTGAERLRELLAAAYGPDSSPARQEGLLAAVDFGGKTLQDWLRDGFFEQHCRVFHNRPFLWHLWDGRKDGFAAVVNYHKLDRRRLETLVHHHLGLWIKRQRDSVDRGESGADGRLAAAEDLERRLKLILGGEPPYDIFVRWKPLAQQPIGWEPDLNDGVRLNIRPFATADVLRRKVPSLHWKKDKGRDPESAPWFSVFKGDRINDHHLSLAEKQAARGEKS